VVSSGHPSQDLDRELWCPKCGGHDYTRPPGGGIGFSQMEVVCDGCGYRYWFSTNLGAEFARDEWEAQQS